MLSSWQKLNENGESNSFSNSYLFDIYAISTHSMFDENGGEVFLLDLQNLATKSIVVKLQQVIDEVKNKILTIVKQKDIYIINKTRTNNGFEDILNQLLEYLIRLVKYAEKENRTLILCFSSCGGYNLLIELFKIIEKLKNIYPNIIFGLGGSDVNEIGNQNFLDMIFAGGIDIINVGGAHEFIEFVGNMREGDRFNRCRNGDLVLETDRDVPQNLLFASSKKNVGEIREITPGKKIDITYYYNELQRIFHFSITNSTCLNSCHYCVNYIHSDRKPLKDKDVEKSVEKFNKYILGIVDDEIVVVIDSSNPMQNIDKFIDFIGGINLEKVIEIGFFADFVGLGDDSKYIKLLWVVEYLKNKYSKIKISILFSIDALHCKGDGDFIGRTHGNNIATENELQLGYQKFMDFIKKYGDDKRINISYNTIFHPNMDLYLYIERLGMMEKFRKFSGGSFSLVPSLNTKISEIHNGYYIPEFESAKYINSGDLYYECSEEQSYWGHFYLNSFLLDTYIFVRNTGLLHIFESLLHKMDGDIDGLRGDLFIDFLKGPIKHVKKILIMKENNKNDIEFTIYYINFVINREKYILENNPDYNSPELELFLKELEEIKGEYMKFKK